MSDDLRVIQVKLTDREVRALINAGGMFVECLSEQDPEWESKISPDGPPALVTALMTLDLALVVEQIER